MKEFLTIVFFSLLLIGCNEKKPVNDSDRSSVDDQLLADYFQTKNGIKTDMNFRLMSFSKVRESLGKDSLLTIYNSFKNEYDEGYNLDTLMNHLRPYYEKYPDGKAGIRYKYLKRYKDLENNVLAVEYLCVYTINNPTLNNTEQEITRTVYLNNDGTKVLGDLVSSK